MTTHPILERLRNVVREHIQEGPDGGSAMDHADQILESLSVTLGPILQTAEDLVMAQDYEGASDYQFARWMLLRKLLLSATKGP